MEPIEVDSFQGRWSEAAPDEHAVRVAVAPESRYPELAALAAEREKAYSTPEESAWVFTTGIRILEHLVILEALDGRDRVLGFGACGRGPILAPGARFLRVVVGAANEGRGVGGALHRELMPRQLPEVVRVHSAVDDRDERSLAVARHWGYAVQEHAMDSEMSLEGAVPPELPQDVTIDDAASLVFADEDAVEAMLAASQTNPEAAAGIVSTLDSLRRSRTEEHPLVAAVARVEGGPAAICVGVLEGDVLYIHYTGVDPAHRGRGLAKLVKQHVHAGGAAAGATLVKTNNEEHNHGIRRINAELGYEVRTGTYRLWRHLT